MAGQTAKETLGPELTAAMDFCDWNTMSIDVPDFVFKNLRSFLNDTQMVEATATTGFYNFVSRFVEALDVDGKMDTLVPIPQ
jgi:alkylhydroperoxidase family enzyme